jgi:hypothetical protein
MIPDKSLTSYDVSGLEGLRMVKAAVRPENVGWLVKVAVEKTYSDKPLAVCREQMTNAFEANCDAGNGHIPFIVTIPTLQDPCVRFRDFGLGLCEDDIINIFISPGASTKRGDNTKGGMYGLGSKSGYAYADSFIVTSWHKGICSRYLMQKGENQDNNCVILSSVPSTEPSGLEVEVAVSVNDAKIFESKVLWLAKFFPTLPKVMKGEEEIKIELVKTNQGEHFFTSDVTEYVGQGSYGGYKNVEAYALMGAVAYPIKYTDAFDASEKLITSSNNAIFMNFSIGELDIPPSREQVEFTQRSIEAIKQKIKMIRKEVASVTQAEVDKSDNILDAYEKVSACVENGGVGNAFGLRMSNFTYRGDTLSGDTLHFLGRELTSFEISRYYRDGGEFKKERVPSGDSRRSRWRRNEFHNSKILFDKKSIILTMDAQSKYALRAINEHAESKLKGIKYVYILTPDFNGDARHFNKLPASSFVKFSELPFTITRSPRTSSGNTPYRGEILKLTSAVRRLDILSRSDFVVVNPDSIPDQNTKKLYFPIKNFKIVDFAGTACFSYDRANSWELLLKEGSANFADIYFLRFSDSKNLGSDWVRADVFYKQGVSEKINKLDDTLKSVLSSLNRSEFPPAWRNISEIIPLSDSYKAVVSSAQTFHYCKESLIKIVREARVLQVEIPTLPSLFEKPKNEFYSKYPLLKMIFERSLDSGAEPAIIDYVKMINAKN